MVARIPPGQIFVGKAAVSRESQGANPAPFPLHRWQMPGAIPFALRSVGSPATMRNPWDGLDSLSGVNRVDKGPHRSKSRRLPTTTVRRHIVDGDTSALRLQLAVYATEVRLLGYQFVRAVLRRPEVQAGCPVVAEVLRIGAARARGRRRRVHGGRVHLHPMVSADDLMKLA